MKTLDQVYGLTATGKTMMPDGTIVMKSYVPGREQRNFLSLRERVGMVC